METDVTNLLDTLDRLESSPAHQRAMEQARVEWIAHASDAELQTLFQALCERDPPRPQSASEQLLGNVFKQLFLRTQTPRSRAQPHEWAANHCKRISCLYAHLGPTSRVRHQLLAVLATARGPAELAELSELLLNDPPSEQAAIAFSLSPLFQNTDYDAGALFPRLLDGLANQRAASSILDLANYVAREKIAAEHPAAHRLGRLKRLLSDLTHRLGRIEERGIEGDEPADELSGKVEQSVALAVSLCDALGLIGDSSAIGALNQALQLGHRRIQTEAAAALAKLGDARGETALVTLAAEPVARLRVLAYAEELGLGDRIDAAFQTPEALAEAELAVWLSQPTQFGIPPAKIELVDRRTQYWPSYDEPVCCYLFRYTYEIGGLQFSNLGIAGPLTHSFAADVADLAPDDIYAAFAGWQAVHAEIYEIDFDRAGDGAHSDLARLKRRLHDDGLEEIRPLKLAVFFGQRVLVAEARRNAAGGLAVADATDVFWYPRGQTRRPLGPEEVYCIYKGKKLLRQFNAP